MRAAVVTPIPTPYRDPFFNVVAAQPGIELDVYYCAASKSDRPWKADWQQNFRAEVLPGFNLASLKGADASCYWNPSLTRRLEQGKYDTVVVGGYNHPTMLAAMRWANRRKRPFVLMCESHDLRPRSGWKQRWKTGFVRRVVRQSSGAFPTGEAAEAYLLRYGADPDHLSRIPNVPDIERIERQANDFRTQRTAHRRELGLTDEPIALFAGRLIAKKRAGLLLNAFAAARQVHPMQLVIVGDGPEKATLVSLAKELGVDDHVRFIGFVEPDAMPQWYALADLFILPSSETWGVVVVEALAASVPVVVSDQVGCHLDVVNNSRVGQVVPFDDAGALCQSLVDRLAKTSTPEEVRAAWGDVRARMKYETVAKDFVDTLQQLAIGTSVDPVEGQQLATTAHGEVPV